MDILAQWFNHAMKMIFYCHEKKDYTMMVSNSTITNKGKYHLSSQQIEDKRDHGI